MNKNKFNKKSVKIYAATCMALFSLTAVFTATIAWFALNEAVEGNGMAVEILTDGDSFTTLAIYRCNTEDSTTNVLKFFDTPAVYTTYEDEVDPDTGEVNHKLVFNFIGEHEGNNIKLDDWGDLSGSQPVLFLFSLPDETHLSDINLTISTTTSAIFEASSISSSNVNSLPLSQFTIFSSGVYFDENYDPDDETSSPSFPFDQVVVSNSTISEIEELDTTSPYAVSNTKQAFVSKPSTAWKVSQTSFSAYSSENSTDTAHYLAVVVDYYFERMEDFRSDLIPVPSAVAANDNRVGFTCDWKMKM